MLETMQFVLLNGAWVLDSSQFSNGSMTIINNLISFASAQAETKIVVRVASKWLEEMNGVYFFFKSTHFATLLTYSTVFLLQF